MVTDIDIVVLPPLLGFQAAPDLYETLLNRCDKPVVLDASEVTHLGAPSLQILISAVRMWRQESVAFGVTAPSAAFLEGLVRLGIGLDELTTEDLPT